MNAQKIIYCPHAKIYWIAVALIPFFLLFLFYFAYLYANELGSFNTVCALLLPLISLFLIRKIIKLSSCVAIFQPDGLMCINMGRNIYDDFSWQDFEVAYICCDMKGHKYLVLSSIELDKRKVKRLTNRGTAVKQCEDSVVVLYIKPTNECQILEFIRQIIATKFIER